MARPQTAPQHHDVPPARTGTGTFYAADESNPPWINDLTLHRPGGTSPQHIKFLETTSNQRANVVSHSNPPWGLQYDATMQPFSVFSRRPDMILHRPFSELIESRRKPAAKEEEPTDEEWLRKLRKRQQQAAQQSLGLGSPKGSYRSLGGGSPLATSRSSGGAPAVSYERLLDELEAHREMTKQRAKEGGGSMAHQPIPGVAPAKVAATNFERLTTPGGSVMLKRVKALSAPAAYEEENARLRRQVTRLQQELLRAHAGTGGYDRYKRPSTSLGARA